MQQFVEMYRRVLVERERETVCVCVRARVCVIVLTPTSDIGRITLKLTLTMLFFPAAVWAQEALTHNLQNDTDPTK